MDLKSIIRFKLLTLVVENGLRTASGSDVSFSNLHDFDIRSHTGVLCGSLSLYSNHVSVVIYDITKVGPDFTGYKTTDPIRVQLSDPHLYDKFAGLIGRMRDNLHQLLKEGVIAADRE